VHQIASRAPVQHNRSCEPDENLSCIAKAARFSGTALNDRFALRRSRREEILLSSRCPCALPQINLFLARVVIPNYVTGIELFVDGGMAQV
jgi:hypothetical protein